MCTNPTLAYIKKQKIFDIKYQRWQRKDRVCLYKEADYKNLWDKGKLVANTVKIPCRKCDECKATEARAWSARITTEAKKHKYNYFVTLTYNDEELKKNNNKTEKKEVQLFIKKLRNAGLRFKYYAVGEYGAKTGRAHYHLALLMDDELEDLKYIHTKKNIYLRSEKIEKTWNKGFIVIGKLEQKSTDYITKYITKSTKKEKWRILSKNFGMELNENYNFYRATNGKITKLTNYEKSQMRETDPEKYYKKVDEVRNEIKKSDDEQLKKISAEKREKIRHEKIKKYLEKRQKFTTL